MGDNFFILWEVLDYKSKIFLDMDRIVNRKGKYLILIYFLKIYENFIFKFNVKEKFSIYKVL